MPLPSFFFDPILVSLSRLPAAAFPSDPRRGESCLACVQSGRWDVINVTRAAGRWQPLWFAAMSWVRLPRRVISSWVAVTKKLRRVPLQVPDTVRLWRKLLFGVLVIEVAGRCRRSQLYFAASVWKHSKCQLFWFHLLKHQVVLNRAVDVASCYSVSIFSSSILFLTRPLGFDLKHHWKGVFSLVLLLSITSCRGQTFQVNSPINYIH